MTSARRNFCFIRTQGCLIILGIFLALGSFLIIFWGKFSITYSLAVSPPVSYQERRVLEPAENISYEVAFQKKQCTCPLPQDGLTVYNLKNYWKVDDLELARKRRQEEYEHYKKGERTENILIASPNSPLGYPIHGVQVMPLSTIYLPGLQINANLPTYKVTLEASLGTIDFLFDKSGNTECQVNGKRGKKLSISTSNIRVLNSILRSITYTSTVYSIDSLDIVKFTLGDHIAQIPVSIRQPPMPRLHDPGPDRRISDLVTITTKTFLRYDKLQTLIKSIRQYYPDIKIIVADDSDNPQKIDEPNVDQYIMPFAKGWFAGRNLAVSQVTTKYYLWVDDDFFFTNGTKIEQLVNVLEKTDLDVVGGKVAEKHFCFTLILEEGGEDGDCLHWRKGGFHTIPGFPNCILTSGVVNFFLARTDRSQAVGFDPKLNRVAHIEFFIDGLGRLRVASCYDISIGHQNKEKPKDKKSAKDFIKYNSFRQSTDDQVDNLVSRTWKLALALAGAIVKSQRTRERRIVDQSGVDLCTRDDVWQYPPDCYEF